MIGSYLGNCHQVCCGMRAWSDAGSGFVRAISMLSVSHKSIWIAVLGCQFGFALAYGPSSFGQQSPDFARDIRPILSNACFHCHGPDEQTREADLRLDNQDGLLQHRDDLFIVKPGDADHSELISRILSSDPDVRMPPPSSNKSLTDEQRQLLVDWVNSGAAWSQHWAFIPPKTPEVPREIPPGRTAEQTSEIDRFLYQAQQRQGLSPSEFADPMTLIRRVFLDLIGLPPTVQEADHWAARLTLPAKANATNTVQTTGSQATGSHTTGSQALDAGVQSVAVNEDQWQALISDLQARPQYGERWARRWLDLARYADTNGYEKDRPRSIWPYRDWVVDAINNDMPFDQFTIEQLAGDMLPNATTSQRIATGFHRNTMLNEEGGIDPLEFRFHAMTDRVATTGTTWLGLTTGCAQCHTHKYDPITHREYFQLMAFLNNADEPSLELPDDAFQARWQANQQKADQLLAALASKWPVETAEAFPVQLLSATQISAGPQKREPAQTPLSTTPQSTTPEATNEPNTQANTPSAEPTIAVSEDGWLMPRPGDADVAAYVVDFELECHLQPQSLDFDRVTLAFRSQSDKPGPGNSAGGNFVLSELAFFANLNDAQISLPVVSATSTVQQQGYELTKAFDGNIATGWGLHGKDGIPANCQATFFLDTSYLRAALMDSHSSAAEATSAGLHRVQLQVRLDQQHGQQHTIGEFHVTAGRSLPETRIKSRRDQSLQTAFQQWLQKERANAVQWKTLKPVEAKATLPILTIQPDDSIFASGDTAKRDDYFLTFAAHDHPVYAIQLETLPDERLPNRGPGSTYYEGTLGDFFLTEIHASAGSQQFAFASASETYSKNRFGNNPANAQLAIDGDIQTGWSVNDGQGERHVAVFRLQKPIPAGQQISITMSFGRHFASSLGRFRFSATAAETNVQARNYSPQIEQLLLLPEDSISPQQQLVLRNQFLLDAPQLAKEVRAIRALQKRPAVPTSLVMQERPAEHQRPTHRHHRGEYLQAEEEVTSGTPEILHSWPADLPLNRLGFARWLCLPQNPLTSRVVVNRHWAAFFGRGLVATTDDFGLQGASPDHPELLDWLATSLVNEDQWSIKSLHRRIVSSATYRQSAVFRSDAARVDPENRLLTCMPRLRLEAEIIRDSLLLASGVLSDKRGGEPVRPLQPDGITEVAFGSPRWDVSSGEDRYRRSLYTMIKRTAPFAMISTFDGPSGEACIAKRDRSNTPLQALTLLNDVMFVDLAHAAAVGLLKSEQAASEQAASEQAASEQAASEDAAVATDSNRVIQLFRQVLTRRPDAQELKYLLSFVETRRQEFTRSPDLASELLKQSSVDTQQVTDSAIEQAVWLTTARALFALDETVTRP